jgi:hypothetical protein
MSERKQFVYDEADLDTQMIVLRRILSRPTESIAIQVLNVGNELERAATMITIIMGQRSDPTVRDQEELMRYVQMLQTISEMHAYLRTITEIYTMLRESQDDLLETSHKIKSS